MGWFYRGQRLLRRVSSYRVSVYAANASFYIILSVFPAIVLVLSLLPYTRLSQSDLVTALSGVIPSVLEPALAYIISDLSQKANGAVASLSALMAVWSSSRGVYCIQLGLNAICGRRESRSYLHTRIVSMLYTVFMIAALLLTLTLHVFGNQLALYFSRQPVPILQLLAKILQFRGLILWLLLTALFTAVMTVFPSQKVRLRDAAPGAAAAALGWLLFSWLFSIYAQYFSSYSVFYGSLSVVALAMLWLYVCMSILFYGGVVNHLLELRKK